MVLPMYTEPRSHHQFLGMDVEERTIDSVEKQILERATENEFVWTTISRMLIGIRDDDLYRQKIDDNTLKPFKTWDAYLRYLSQQLRKKLSSGAVSTIKAWINKFELYEDQMGHDEDWLVTMGSHANILMQVANIAAKTRKLDTEDRILPNGGVKLGHQSFATECDRIHERITTSISDEDAWGIADTRARVKELLGSDAPVVKEWNVKVLDNNLVQVQGLRYIVGDIDYEAGALKSLFLLDHFRKITKGPHHVVSGLPDGV